MSDLLSDDRPSAPPDLWARLARLDHTCHVSVHSLYIANNSGTQPERIWEVEIRSRARPGEEPIRFRDPHMRNVLYAGVLESERRGWSGPTHPAPPASPAS
ncbi:MAG: hypothetical protein WD749_07120 [Phycisphaerales bacterium]